MRSLGVSFFECCDIDRDRACNGILDNVAIKIAWRPPLPELVSYGVRSISFNHNGPGYQAAAKPQMDASVSISEQTPAVASSTIKAGSERRQLKSFLLAVGVVLSLINRFISIERTINSVPNAVVVIAAVFGLLDIPGLPLSAETGRVLQAQPT